MTFHLFRSFSVAIFCWLPLTCEVHSSFLHNGSFKKNSCQLTARQRFPGLFLSREKVMCMLVDPDGLSEESYRISEVQLRVPYNPKAEEVATEARTRFSRATSDPCCTTTMTMTIPYTVVPKYDSRQQFKVKHLSTSYQILHEGKCASPGAACTMTGTCQLMYRVQWVLVEKGDGTDTFIPVEVANHCYCQYH
ncbi:unnamed protein product [Lymnaea stagnalis]|uniref:Spaetzle domain-containing protein n=1 Tax=Lymnaea stagnalis TaxID=6523 RepID=A0AAV2IEE0_LYMST